MHGMCLLFLVQYLKTAFVVLDQDDLCELGDDHVQAIGDIVHSAMDSICLDVQELCRARVVLSVGSEMTTER